MSDVRKIGRVRIHRIKKWRNRSNPYWLRRRFSNDNLLISIPRYNIWIKSKHV